MTLNCDTWPVMTYRHFLFPSGVLKSYVAISGICLVLIVLSSRTSIQQPRGLEEDQGHQTKADIYNIYERKGFISVGDPSIGESGHAQL